MIECRKLGYDYINDDECFENIILIYDNDELYWISCSDNVLDNIDQYFDDEIFIMSFSLQRRKDYNMIFATNIRYKEVLQDLKMNGIDKNVKLLFNEREYNKYLQFKIMSNTFDNALLKLKVHLSTLRVEVI